MSQFQNVSSRYGAPMGRHGSPLGCTPRGVRLFRVRLNSGGYDDGGAYWGHGEPLWCAECPEGGRQFVRADGRLSAIVALDIEAQAINLRPRARVENLQRLASTGRASARGVNLLSDLRELGY